MPESIFYYTIISNSFVVLIILGMLFWIIIKRPELGIALLIANRYILAKIYLLNVSRKNLLFFTALAVFISIIHYLYSNYAREGRIFKSIPKNFGVIVLVLFAIWVVLIYQIHKDPSNIVATNLFYTFLMGSLLPFFGLICISNNRKMVLKHIYWIGMGIFINLMLIFINFLIVVGKVTSLGNYRLISIAEVYVVSYVQYAAVLFFIALIWLRTDRKERIKKIAFLIAMFLSILIILLGSSRALLVAVAISGLFILNTQRKKRIFASFMAIVIILGIVFSILTYFPGGGELNRLLKQRFDIKQIKFGPSLESRLRLNEIAFDKFLEHPITGVGLGNGGYWVTRVNPFKSYTESYALHVHNSWMRILSEQGIVGFLLFVMFFFWGLKHARNAVSTSKLSKNFKIGMTAYSIILLWFFMSITGDSYLIYWAVGLAWIASSYTEKERFLKKNE